LFSLGLLAGCGGEGDSESSSTVASDSAAPDQQDANAADADGAADASAEPAADETPEEPEQERLIQRLGQVSAPSEDEWVPESFDLPDPAADINFALEQASTALQAGNLLEPEGESARDFYLSVLESDPENEDAQQGLRNLGAELVAAGAAALDDGNVRQAVTYANAVDQLDIASPSGLADLNRRLTRQRSIAAALQAGTTAAAEGRLVAPAENSAAYFFRQGLEIDPGNSDALRGLEVVEEAVLERAIDASDEGDFVGARRWLGIASDVREGDSSAVEQAELAIADAETAAVDQLVAQAEQALANDDVAGAVEVANVLSGMQAGEQPLVDAIIERVRLAEVYGNFEPGQRFSDAPAGAVRSTPEMVVLPSRVFQLGSPDDEIGRDDNEGPQQEISMNRPMAMARTEITVGQFAEFVDATGYVTDAERGDGSVINESGEEFDQDSGISWRNDYRGESANRNEPVVHVSWNDANNYVNWLSAELGAQYRLPSEAEFEYALRGGTETRYWWGYGGPSEVLTNAAGSRDLSPQNLSWSSAFYGYGDGYWGASPVGTFRENGFGLMDMAGNVSEWTADCYRPDLTAIPNDGSVTPLDACPTRTMRGGSWASHPQDARSAARFERAADYRDARVGFRVVKILEI
jgi:formylglycine-generating enzyme required for sulfatase activity